MENIASTVMDKSTSIKPQNLANTAQSDKHGTQSIKSVNDEFNYLGFLYSLPIMNSIYFENIIAIYINLSVIKSNIKVDYQ